MLTTPLMQDPDKMVQGLCHWNYRNVTGWGAVDERGVRDASDAHFAYRIDTWSSNGESVVEHVAFALVVGAPPLHQLEREESRLAIRGNPQIRFARKSASKGQKPANSMT